MREADAVIYNARRALRKATGQTKGRLQRAINELDTTPAAHPAGRCPDPQSAGGR